MKGAWPRPLLGGAMLSLLALLALLGLAQRGARTLLAELPRLPEDPRELGLRPGTEIYASSGERIYSFNQSRQWVPLDKIPTHLIYALLATEDRDFYQHRGVDVRALFAALWANLRHGYGARGGSTLTQQLVKRLFFSPRKTLRRKLSEMLLALELEALYARTFPGRAKNARGEAYPRYKDRLLELYLNTVFYGANAYGLAEATSVYFGRPAAGLTLPQSALLMGLVNAPSAYNPLQHPERATGRLRHVLRRMREARFISARTYRRLENLRAADLVDPHRIPHNPAPYWVEAIKAEIARRWGAEVLRYGALRIHTTLDLRLQRAAEEAVARGVADLDRRLGFAPYDQAPLEERRQYVQAALVCLDPHSGRVRAMVGGRDIFASFYNRALSARRQPGSGFKPVAYLAALEAGAISPLSLFVDEPRSYEIEGRLWRPRNYGGHYLGLTTAAWALVRSANSTAVQITERVGPRRIVEMARSLGFAGPMEPYMSIALGVNEVTLLEMVSAFGTLAASGLHIEPTLVARIVDAEGSEVFAHRPAIEQAVAPDLAYQMLHLLRQVVDRGTGRRVRRAGFRRPAAGKTGTTNDNADAWFTGFTPELSAGVWIGFDDRKAHKLIDTRGRQISGGTGAAPIWARFMSAALKNAPPSEFPVAKGLRIVRVDPSTGVAAAQLPDSLRSIAPLSVALRPHERLNETAQVLDFAHRQERGMLDPMRAEPGRRR